MSKRILGATGALLASAALLVAPASGLAHVRPHRTVRSTAALSDHCIVKQIGSLTFTVCYLTP